MTLDISPTLHLGSPQCLQSKETLGLRRGRCRNQVCDTNKDGHRECCPNEKPLAVPTHPTADAMHFFYSPTGRKMRRAAKCRGTVTGVLSNYMNG